MGWVSVAAAPEIARILPWEALGLLVGGGVLYSVGALIYALRRPDPFPRVFGYHEIFHLFVIAGSAAFLFAIWVWVVPFPRS
jgi:hemolysin III